MRSLPELLYLRNKCAQMLERFVIYWYCLQQLSDDGDELKCVMRASVERKKSRIIAIVHASQSDIRAYYQEICAIIVISCMRWRESILAVWYNVVVDVVITIIIIGYSPAIVLFLLSDYYYTRIMVYPTTMTIN